ncbi:MAG: vitamin K epoxide reductase family protein [Patescibacteria group bacterium]
MPIIFLLLILVVAVIGFVSSVYIYRHREHGKNVECVIGSDCDSIIFSRYNSFFNIPNDKFGFAYFGLTLLLSVVGIITAGAPWVSILILLITLIATGYSLYLIYIQIKILKHTCTWCLVPTIAAIIIFLATLGIISL